MTDSNDDPFGFLRQDETDGVFCLLKQRIIYLGTEITSEVATEINKALFRLEADRRDKSVTFYIDSGGGAVNAAWAIVAAMRKMESHIITYAIGDCLSAAVMLYLAGDERRCHQFSTFMIHPEFHMITEETKNLSLYTEYAKKLHVQVQEWMLSRMGKKSTKKTLGYFDGSQHWLDATEAKAAGLVHEIEEVL